MKKLLEEYVDGKTYLFRGESRNNYHNRAKTGLNSRYYAYEIFDLISAWGDVVIYELLPSANIFEWGESVEDFIEEYNLQDIKSPILKKLYGVDSISEIEEGRSYHDLYHSWQIIATIYLETQTDYDGIVWYEWSDTPEYQVQIWNNSKVRRLPYGEAKKLVDKLAEMNPDMYSKINREDEWNKRQFKLKRR